MDNTVINRATQKIDVNDFRILTQLHKEYEWLQDEPDALFELWCLTDNDEQKKLIEFLIRNFLHINGRNLNDGCKHIALHIESCWKLTERNTFISATCDDSAPDGSQSLIQSLKNKFSTNWRESNFHNSLPVAMNTIPDNYNIVLVDDFIGTGDTIKNKKIKYVNSVISKRGLSNVTIYIVSLAAMHFAKEALDILKMEYFSVHWLYKGISEQMDEHLRANAIKEMESLESKLKKKIRSKELPNFGYKRSESLFTLELDNIPNNVFPIFWWSQLKGGVTRKTIFRRI